MMMKKSMQSNAREMERERGGDCNEILEGESVYGGGGFLSLAAFLWHLRLRMDIALFYKWLERERKKEILEREKGEASMIDDG